MTKQLTWPTVGLIAVISGVTIALATLTEWQSGEILGVAGLLAGIGAGAAVGGAASAGMAGQVEAVRTETQAQTQQLTNIERRVNGELDARIKDAVDRGNRDLLEMLDQRRAQ